METGKCVVIEICIISINYKSDIIDSYVEKKIFLLQP